MHSHAHEGLWKTICFTTVSATAQLLCLDWMQLKLLTDSPLLSCLSLKVDQIGKTRSPDIIESTNSMRNIPDSNTCAWAVKKAFMGNKKKSPVAFDYMAAGGSQPPSDDFNTQRSPQSNSRLTSFTPSRDFSISTKREKESKMRKEGES